MSHFLIAGLGNPGKKYEATRHNAGFLFLDFLQREWCFPNFSPNNRFQSSIAEGSLDSNRILLVRPETFMNRSGEAILNLLSFYKIPQTHLAVIHDDLDIPLGSFRRATDSRAAGHNGVQNIIDRLGSQEFCRFRLGIGAGTPDNSENSSIRIPSERFVLEPFPKDEYETLRSIFPDVQTSVESWLREKGN